MAAFTQKQYETLCSAIAEGTLRVHYGDKIVEYRSLNEMFRIKAMMEDSLGLNSKPSTAFAEFNKGIK